MTPSLYPLLNYFRHKVQNDRQLAAKVDELANSNPQLMFFVVSSNKNNNADM